MLPPGRFRDSTNPCLTGSSEVEKTTGIVTPALLGRLCSLEASDNYGHLMAQQISQQ